MAFLLRSMGSATAITGDPAALSPRSWGSYHASSTCITSAWRPQGVSTTFSRRLYNKQIKFFGNFQRINFRGVFATRVLRVYYVYGDVTTLGSRPSRPHRVLIAFQVRSPNLGVCFEHAQNKRRDSAIIGDHNTMSGVSTTFIPRLYHAYGDLGALWTHFPSP